MNRVASPGERGVCTQKCQVLSIQKALSIQAHPDKQRAAKLHEVTWMSQDNHDFPGLRILNKGKAAA